MQVSVNTLQAEILEVEGVAVAIHTAKVGDTFPSYKLRWKTGLDNERKIGAFKRRLEHSLSGYSYSIQRADGDKSVSPFAKMSSLRKFIPA